MKFFIVCPGGLEAVLAQELEEIVTRPEIKALGRSSVEPAPSSLTGGIGVEGPLALSMAINLYSRIASRVLLKMADGPINPRMTSIAKQNQLGGKIGFPLIKPFGSILRHSDHH